MEPPLNVPRRVNTATSSTREKRAASPTNIRKRSTSPIGTQLNSAKTTAPSALSKRPIVGTSTEWKSRGDINKHASSLHAKIAGPSITAKMPSPPPRPPVSKAQSSSRPPQPSSAAAAAKTNRKGGVNAHPMTAPKKAIGNYSDKSNDARIKGPWTKEEDALLSQLVKEFGPKKWSVIASHVPGRIGKQCRERWLNHLDSSVKKTPWTEHEDETLLQAQDKVGNRWCEIAKLLPGRPENAVKNRWNSLMNRRWSQKPTKDQANKLGLGSMSGLGAAKANHPAAGLGVASGQLGGVPRGGMQANGKYDAMHQSARGRGRPGRPGRPSKIKTETSKPGSDLMFGEITPTNAKQEPFPVHPNDVMNNREPWINPQAGSLGMSTSSIGVSNGQRDSMEYMFHNDLVGGPRGKQAFMEQPFDLMNLDLSLEPIPFNTSVGSFHDPKESLDMELSSSSRRPANGSAPFDRISMSLSGLSLETGDFKELFEMPMTPHSISSPRNGGVFGSFTDALDRSTPNPPMKCLSPTAARLQEINGSYKDGKIDAEQKAQMKSRVLRESAGAVAQ